jgi:hypothetical protein
MCPPQTAAAIWAQELEPFLEGSPWIDVTKYGAAGDGITTNRIRLVRNTFLVTTPTKFNGVTPLLNNGQIDLTTV